MTPDIDWISHLHSELRQLAGALLAREREGHTLSATALVHEAWLRLADSRQRPWQTAAEFYPVASRVMRRVLIDHARKNNAQRRPPLRLRLDIEDAQPQVEPVHLDLVLSRLEDYDPRLALVVELRAIGGLTIEETASHLGVDSSEVKRDWTFAKTWLRRELTP